MTKIHKAVVRIINEKGLHARTASLFVQCVQNSPKDTVTVISGEKEVDGASILSLLTLSAVKGTSLTICTTGKTAKDTLLNLVRLIEDGFV